MTPLPVVPRVVTDCLLLPGFEQGDVVPYTIMEADPDVGRCNAPSAPAPTPCPGETFDV